MISRNKILHPLLSPSTCVAFVVFFIAVSISHSLILVRIIAIFTVYVISNPGVCRIVQASALGTFRALLDLEGHRKKLESNILIPLQTVETSTITGKGQNRSCRNHVQLAQASFKTSGSKRCDI